MKTISFIKNILLSILAFFLLTACGGGSGTSTSTTSTTSISNNSGTSSQTNNNDTSSQITQDDENTYNTASGEEINLGSTNPVCKVGTSYQEGQIKDFDTNIGIANVKIVIDGCEVYTDGNGFYKLENIASNDRTSITVSKEGYYANSTILSIDEETTNYLELNIEKFRSWNPTIYNSKDGKDIGFINIPSNITYSLNHTTYEGNITAYYRNLKLITEHGRDMFPGSFEGLDKNNLIVPFVSYDFFVLDLKDDHNNTLDTLGTISIKVTDVPETNDQVIPLWYYNYNQGIWIEDGIAQRDENGDYICEISHPGTWSISKPIETEMGIYKGRIVDENENPIPHVRIQAMGKNWINKDLTTDENGIFEIQVVPEEDFTLVAYDYKEKFGAKFPNTIPGISSGEIVEE